MRGELANAVINSIYALVVQIVYLTIGSFWDLRKRLIPGWYVRVLGPAIGLITFWINKTDIRSSLWSLVLTIPMIAFSLIFPEILGMADSLILFEIGMGFGFYGVLSVLATAVFFCAIVGGVCLVSGKFSRKSTLPFVPFILLGLVAGSVI